METYENEIQDDEEVTLVDALGQQLNAAPWYISSVGIHCILFLILLMIPVNIKDREERIVQIQVSTVEPIDDIEIEPIVDPIDTPIEPKDIIEDTIVVDEPIVNVENIEISDKIETEDDMESENALGDPDNISSVDSEYVGKPALMGVGSSGNSGGGGVFGDRTGGGKRITTRTNGGTPKTKDAVKFGLKWLVSHQEADGSWSSVDHEGTKNVDVAVTSLALLALLGDGNSSKFGPYKTNVRRATAWLKYQQKESGLVGEYRYQHPIAGMALAEAFGMGDKTTRDAAVKALELSIKSQNTSGGWDYNPNSNRSDTSVTGWFIMQLKSAKVSGLHVESEVFEKATDYIQRATTKPNSVADKCSTSYSSNGEVKRGGGSQSMTAVGMTCLQFLGLGKGDEQVIGLANSSITSKINPNSIDFYKVYYQALGFFQTGVKDKYWKEFVDPFRVSMTSAQVKDGTVQELKGSWNPDKHHCAVGGRVLSTALGCLSMEVFYRYNVVK